MSEYLKSEREAKIDSVFYFAGRVKKLKEELSDLTKTLNNHKEELRGIMIELDEKELKNEEHEIKLARPYSFDVGQLGVDYPELYKKYTSIEKVISEKVVCNKKDLKKFYPQEYHKCEVELTPRLTIK